MPVPVGVALAAGMLAGVDYAIAADGLRAGMLPRQEQFQHAWLATRTTCLRDHRFEVVRVTLTVAARTGHRGTVVDLRTHDGIAHLHEILDSDRDRAGVSVMVEFAYRAGVLPRLARVERPLTALQLSPPPSTAVPAPTRVRFPDARYVPRGPVSPAAVTGWDLGPTIRLILRAPAQQEAPDEPDNRYQHAIDALVASFKPRGRAAAPEAS